jgi:hypothetical protein
MDCTTMGWHEPMATLPIQAVGVGRRVVAGMGGS